MGARIFFGSHMLQPCWLRICASGREIVSPDKFEGYRANIIADGDRRSGTDIFDNRRAS